MFTSPPTTFPWTEAGRTAFELAAAAGQLTHDEDLPASLKPILDSATLTPSFRNMPNHHACRRYQDSVRAYVCASSAGWIRSSCPAISVTKNRANPKIPDA